LFSFLLSKDVISVDPSFLLQLSVALFELLEPAHALD